MKAHPFVPVTATLVATALVVSAFAYGRQQLPGDAGKIASIFQPFAPKVQTHADSANFYVESDGMPDHPMMVGITAWQQQVPLPQRYTGANSWQFPLKPVPAPQPLSAKNHFFRGAIAIAANGVPIFNALNNRGDDAFLAGELDEYGGHSGRADDYHYHIAPIYLEKIVGKGKPIAYAFDGYPLYGLTEPDGTAPGKLDELNGHSTAALGYHYHSTRTYPYINGGFHGTVTEREGQVDPQPRAQPVRPATTPLRGAKITGFSRPLPGSYSLTYEIAGQTGKVNYRLQEDGSYTFDYVSPSGIVEKRTYHPQPSGPSRRGGRDPQNPEGRDPNDRREGGRSPQPPAPRIVTPQPTDFQVKSPLVANGGQLPRDFTCDGVSDSPPLEWKNAPAGTKAFALVMHHNPPGDEEPHVYWIVYDIPASVWALPRNDTATGKHGTNTVNRTAAYAPPCSQGPGRKWYTVTLYALSEDRIDVPAPTTRDALLKAIRDKTLGTAVLHMFYERSREPGIPN
jgi:hypothetical protein